MDVIYPLFDIKTEITIPIQIGKGITVLACNIETEKLHSTNLSQDDKYQLQQAKHCLIVDKNQNKPEQASLIFIISCRLLKPTKVFIRYRVDNEKNIVSKIRDDYPFVPSSNVTSNISNANFLDISKIYSGLNCFKVINSRTANASYFLGLAYRSRKWLEALLFHVCALETITSSADREQRVTEKFAKRISNFISYDEEFLKKIYNIRSELIHGRYAAESEDDNLKYFLIAEEVCRSVFLKILTDKIILASFCTDEARMKIFGT